MGDDAQRTTAPTVAVTMQQAYDLHLNVTLLPTRNIPGVLRLGCQPRQGAQRVDADPLQLPESTRKFLIDANKRVTEWLAAGESNQHAFLKDPIGALQMAGVKMERADLKALTRMREAIGSTQAVVPGLQLRSIRSTASKMGTVRAEVQTQDKWTIPPLRPSGGEGDGGCDDKGRA